MTSAICNDRQEWNENKCRWECKEDLVSKLVCDKGYMWNPSTCSCECDRYCETGQYLDYKNCICRKKIIDDLIEKCTSIVDMDIKNNTLSKKSDESSSNIYFILFIVFLVLFILFLVGFIYYWRKNNKAITKKMYDVIYSNTGTLNYENCANNYKMVIKQLVLKKNLITFLVIQYCLKILIKQN